MNHDINYKVVMINPTTILYRLSISREYWAHVQVNSKIWPMGLTLRWSYIPYILGNIDKDW